MSLFFFISCKTLKLSINEKVNLKESCTSIMTNGYPVIDAKIDNVPCNVIFDSGSMASVVVDSSIIKDFGNIKFASFGSFYGADRKKKKNRLLPLKISTELFDSDNKLMLYAQIPGSECSAESTVKAIVGLDAFFNNKLSLLLDFSNSKICNVSSIKMHDILSEGSFSRIKSICRNNQVFVFLSIDGKEHKFKLDTGYSGSIIIPFVDHMNFSKYNSIDLEGSFYKTIDSETAGLECFYEKIPAKIGSYETLVKISVSTSIKAQNIGINFIKAFDLLIDYNHNKVYVKRNHNTIESSFKRGVMYYARVNNDSLEIVVKEKSQTKFNIGDEIVSVNGQKVTAENQCELQDLLNKTEDWNGLQIEVLSKSK